MSNKTRVDQLKSITDGLNIIIDSFEQDGNTEDLEQQLTVVNKKIDVFNNEFGESNVLFKQVKALSSKANLMLEEKRYLNKFI